MPPSGKEKIFTGKHVRFHPIHHVKPKGKGSAKSLDVADGVPTLLTWNGSPSVLSQTQIELHEFASTTQDVNNVTPDGSPCDRVSSTTTSDTSEENPPLHSITSASQISSDNSAQIELHEFASTTQDDNNLTPDGSPCDRVSSTTTCESQTFGRLFDEIVKFKPSSVDLNNIFVYKANPPQPTSKWEIINLKEEEVTELISPDTDALYSMALLSSGEALTSPPPTVEGQCFDPGCLLGNPFMGQNESDYNKICISDKNNNSKNHIPQSRQKKKNPKVPEVGQPASDSGKRRRTPKKETKGAGERESVQPAVAMPWRRQSALECEQKNKKVMQDERKAFEDDEPESTTSETSSMFTPSSSHRKRCFKAEPSKPNRSAAEDEKRRKNNIASRESRDRKK